ncbi:UNVERIFIED_ORG: hypothetical protein J2Y81_007766 [Paraburkholderia sediminicola]|nr:hypothetical protein [Paraburkholderia sediminicola]
MSIAEFLSSRAELSGIFWTSPNDTVAPASANLFASTLRTGCAWCFSNLSIFATHLEALFESKKDGRFDNNALAESL